MNVVTSVLSVIFDRSRLFQPTATLNSVTQVHVVAGDIELKEPKRIVSIEPEVRDRLPSCHRNLHHFHHFSIHRFGNYFMRTGSGARPRRQ
jgi:hypothetical protein